MVYYNSTYFELASESDDATWILTSAFIIFTMQSGFGLLEAGMVSSKNEANIMIKNAVDVVFGGLAFWIFGYGLSFGTDGNAFIGFGSFLTDADEATMGKTFSNYIFQLSFSTTATTIVSGAMAERTKLRSYMIYSFTNTFTYCLPAHWIWSDQGFLSKMGAVDIAGGAPVHVVGGASALVATLTLKPRHRRFDGVTQRYMASPPTVILGTFMLWWGWLGFNCGSTFGISGHKWKLASRAAVVTINASIGGALFAIIYSYSRKKFKGRLHIPVFATGILGGLVGVTAICAICRPWEAILIGFVGGSLAVTGDEFLARLGVDDPVSCISTHLFSGAWGVVAVSLFAEKDNLEGISGAYGILKGGSFKFLGVQLLTVVTVTTWTVVITAIMLFSIQTVFGMRVSLEDELIGADICEHGICKDSALEVFFPNIKNLIKEDPPEKIESYNPIHRDSGLSSTNGNVEFKHSRFRRKQTPFAFDHVINIKDEEDGREVDEKVHPLGF